MRFGTARCRGLVGKNERPYFSRRIGLSADGEPVSLDVGGKLSGRIGRWNVGTMLIQQAEFEDIDATPIAVARATVNLFEESNLGLILTSGDRGSNFNNTLIGADYRYTNSRLSNGAELMQISGTNSPIAKK